MMHAPPVRILIALVAAVAALAPVRADGVDAIVERFLTRVDEPLASYRGERRLHARNERFGVEGWLDAGVSLSPEGEFTFAVLREGGSAYVRNKVLRRALQGEREIVAQGKVQLASLTPGNYAFAPVPDDPADCIDRVALRPLRKDVLLVDGVMTLDGDGDLLSVEGRLSKSPSFWTSRVQVVRRYGRIAGVRVPMSLESTASVRIAGTSKMTVNYVYSEINGRMVLSNEVVTVELPLESPE